VEPSPEIAGIDEAKPERGVFLSAEWRDLVVLTFAIPRELLTPYLLPGLELDLWEGKAMASLVGFRFLKTRVLGVPVPGHTDFPEVNLRFYVLRRTPHGIRRGVVFVKEIVPRAAIAAIARGLYGENYVRLPMDSAVEPGRRARYGWNTSREVSNWMQVEAGGAPFYPDPESLDAFIVEHHWGYSCARQTCVEYYVSRDRWRVYPVAAHARSIDVAATYGPEFVAPLSAEPVSVIYAEGSPITVSFGARV
jgi:uncharacterized protein